MTDAEKALEDMRKVNSPVTALKFFEKWGNYDGCILERALDALKSQEKPVMVTVQTSQLNTDLVGLIMRLSWKLGPEHKMSKLAMDFLERKGLVPSSLRTDSFKKLCDEVDEEVKIIEGGK